MFKDVANVHDHNYLWCGLLFNSIKYLHGTIMLFRLGLVKRLRLLIIVYILCIIFVLTCKDSFLNSV